MISMSKNKPINNSKSKPNKITSTVDNMINNDAKPMPGRIKINGIMYDVTIGAIKNDTKNIVAILLCNLKLSLQSTYLLGIVLKPKKCNVKKINDNAINATVIVEQPATAVKIFLTPKPKNMSKIMYKPITIEIDVPNDNTQWKCATT